MLRLRSVDMSLWPCQIGAVHNMARREFSSHFVVWAPIQAEETLPG